MNPTYGIAVVFAVLATGAAAQKPPAPVGPKPVTPAAVRVVPVVTEVVLAEFLAAPHRAYFRAPDFTFANGDLVAVRGRNFGAPGDRSLQLRLDGRRVAMIVSVWTDTLIRAHVPGASAFGITLSGSHAQRRDVSGEIGVLEKGQSTWLWHRPVRVAFLWNWQQDGDRDGDGIKSNAYGGTDCDDRDGRRYPGNPEVGDTLGVDEDCNGTTIGGVDIDGDEYDDVRIFNWVNGRVTKRGQDCDDHKANVNPRSVEACNNKDDNCDGFIDEELLNCPTANRRVGG